MRWVKQVEDGAYIVRRTAEGWTVETVNQRGRNLFGPRLVSQEVALAILRGTSAMGRYQPGLLNARTPGAIPMWAVDSRGSSPAPRPGPVR